MQKKLLSLFPHHILTFMTGGLMSGIYLSHLHPSLLWKVLVLAALSIATYFYAHHPFNNPIISLLIIWSALFLGFIRHKQQTTTFEQLYTHHKTNIDCHAIVDSIEQTPHKRFKYIITLITNKIKLHNQWTNSTHTIQLYIYKKPNIFVGDELEFIDLSIKRPNNHDFAKYLKKEKISATCFLPYCNPLLIHRPAFNLKRLISDYKRKLLNTLQDKLSTTTFKLFSTIFLGKKSKQLSNKIKKECKIWGISHYLARSGLHLIIFVLIWNFLINLFRFPSRIKSMFLILIALIYYMLSWTSISFNRAFFTFLLHHICTFFFLPTHIYHLLLLVCFATLFNNPYQLFFLDFQLSFSLALTIAWFNQLSRQRHRKTQLKLS